MKVFDPPDPTPVFRYHTQPLSGNITNGVGETEERPPRRVFHWPFGKEPHAWMALDLHFNFIGGQGGPAFGWGMVWQRLWNLWQTRRADGPVAAKQREVSNPKAMTEEIKKGLDYLKLEKKPKIICEPGRAIVAESGSTIAKVILRKKQKLFINDGTYGTLFDAGIPNIVYPSRLITNGRIISKKMTSFDFYGPTCDSIDYMKGPFVLPNNVKENDYIELGQLGGYGLTFRTKFNGFFSDEIYEVEDQPIMTMYDKETREQFLVA